MTGDPYRTAAALPPPPEPAPLRLFEVIIHGQGLARGLADRRWIVIATDVPAAVASWRAGQGAVHPEVVRELRDLEGVIGPGGDVWSPPGKKATPHSKEHGG